MQLNVVYGGFHRYISILNYLAILVDQGRTNHDKNIVIVIIIVTLSDQYNVVVR